MRGRSRYNEVRSRWPRVGVIRTADSDADAVAHSEEPPRPPTHAVTSAASHAASPMHPLREGLACFVIALVVSIVGYLALVVPGAWFPSASPKEWSPRQLGVARGAAALEHDALVVAASGGTGGVLVNVETDFRSSDYPTIAWTASNIPEQANVRLVWRSDYAPAKINSTAIPVASGQLLPVTLAKDPNWIGRILGLAVAINGTLPQPVRIRGMAAKPMGVVDVAQDRLGEWIAFEGLSGTSIDGITGGGEVQDLPLPVLLATAIALAALGWFGFSRRRAERAALPGVLATLFVAGWFVADMRATGELVRQARATATRYAGLDWRERHLAAEDGPLFQFIESVRAKLPHEPTRVFMTADARYFRGRGAYHLYPHNVFYEPFQNALPGAAHLRPGDFFVVYQRRGVQFDPGTDRLRWDGGEPVSAELLLTGPGAALFRIR